MARRRMPMSALLVSVLLVAALALLVLPALCRMPAAMKRGDCAVELKQFGLTCKMYAIETGGVWPRRAPYDAPMGWMASAEDLFPDYWNGCDLFYCPADRRQVDVRGEAWLPPTGETAALLDRACPRARGYDTSPIDLPCLHYVMSTARSYVYTGYVVWDWQALRAIDDARRAAVAGGVVEDSLTGFGEGPCSTLENPIPRAPAFYDLDPLIPDGNVPVRGAFHPEALRGSTPGGLVQLLRLREGVVHVLEEEGAYPARKGEAGIPVFWEGVATPLSGGGLVFNHPAAPGGNVLFMDGHVGYVSAGTGQFPYSTSGLGPAYDLTQENVDHFLFGQG